MDDGNCIGQIDAMQLLPRLARPIFTVCAGSLLLLACQQGIPQQKPAPSKAPDRAAAPVAPVAKAAPAANTEADYAKDIDALCNSMVNSGASEQPDGARQLMVAQYLGKAIQTDAAHNFLVGIQPLQGAAKSEALNAEATRVGLHGCPLANEWQPGSTNEL